MSPPHHHRQGDSPKAISKIDNVLDSPTGPASESSHKPSHHRNDWRPAFEKKVEGMLYSFGASWDRGSNSNVLKMGEAHHACAIGSQDTDNKAQIGKGYYMKAMSPGVDFDASSVEEARKQRMNTLQRSIRGGEKLESVSQENNKNSTWQLEKSEQECQDELTLLRSHVTPRRGRNQRTIGMVKSDEQQTPAADSLTLLQTNEEKAPDSPDPSSPHDVGPITSAGVWAVLRKRSSHQDSVSGWESGDSDASTVTSATNAALWRCESKYDSPEEEQQQEEEDRGRRSLRNSVGTLTDLDAWVGAETPEAPESPWRRDSALAGLEEENLGATGGGKVEEAKPPEPGLSQSPSSLVDSYPLPGRRGHHPAKNHSPRKKTAQRQPEHKKPRSKSVVKETAQRTRRPTAAEKGKWPAKCECEKCQPQKQKRVRFDSSAMDKAEDGPGLSHEGFVKQMKENRRKMEAKAWGEGCSSWATTVGPAGVVGLDMFTNPRPAPRVPVRRQEGFKVTEVERVRKSSVNKHDIGQPLKQNRNMEPMDRFRVFPPACEVASAGPRAGREARPRGDPAAGEAAPVALETNGTSRRPVWLPRRLRK